MAYTRRVPKVDIRSLNVKSLPIKEEHRPAILSVPAVPEKQAEILIHHNPLLEVKRIAWCGIPLIAILFVVSYADAQKSWVIPFAEWLMRLGR